MRLLFAVHGLISIWLLVSVTQTRATGTWRQHGSAACGDDHHTGQEGRQGVEMVSSLSESVCPWKWSIVCLDSASHWTWSVPPESVSSWELVSFSLSMCP